MDPAEADCLCQTMSWAGRELVPGGHDIDVTQENFHDFQHKAAALILDGGIAQQMDTIRAGFNEVPFQLGVIQ